MQSISLSEDQLQRTVNLRDSFNISTAANRAQMMALSNQIAAELAKPSIDKNNLNDLHSRMTKLHAELSDEHFKFITANAEILTPEQRTKMHQMFLQHQAGPGHPPLPFMGMGIPGAIPGMLPFGLSGPRSSLPPFGPFGPGINHGTPHPALGPGGPPPLPGGDD